MTSDAQAQTVSSTTGTGFIQLLENNAPAISNIVAATARYAQPLPALPFKDRKVPPGTTLTDVPPAACTLRAEDDAEVQFAELAEGKPAGKDRFHITGYSGDMIPGHWWWGDLVLDLAGMHVSKQKLPVLLNHDRDARVGFSESIKLSNEQGLVVDGSFMRSTDAAKQVLAEAREGYPWQASIHAQPLEIERMESGSSARVNGKQFDFPTGGTIFRKSRFREVSFVTLGADEATSAEALSAAEKVSVAIVKAPMEQEQMGNEQEQKGPTAPVALTLERLKADHPEVFAAAVAEGVSRERARVVEVFDAAPDAHRELFGSIVKDGVSINEGLKRLLADGRRIKAEKLSAIAAAADSPVGAAPEAEKKFASPEDRWKAEYAASASLQAEFGEPDYYIAFQQAKSLGRVSIAGKGA